MRLRLAGIFFVLWGFVSTAFADGIYIPERAIRKIPEIPTQRALLSWKDGQETLVIASSLDSESQKLGWIIPLPAVPTQIEKATPGTIATLQNCIQPEIYHDFSKELKSTLVFMVMVNVLAVSFVFLRRYFLVVFCIVMMTSLCFLPIGCEMEMSGSNQASKNGAIQVEFAGIVGSYEIQVLRAAAFDDLNKWLSENEFASMPQESQKAVEDYLTKGWVFTTVKFARSFQGMNTPHPIKMTFSSKEPVYPMQLTALAGGSPYFELFVIADDRMACDRLKEEFCDRFERKSYVYRWHQPEDRFYAQNNDTTIGHPNLVTSMWDDCILTKLSGKIDATNMAEDIHFQKQLFKPFREHFYTYQGAHAYSLIIFIELFGVWCFITLLLWRKKALTWKGARQYLVYFFVPGLIVSLGGMKILNFSLPQIPMSNVVTGRFWVNNGFQQQSAVEFIIKDNPEILTDNEKNIVKILEKKLDALAKQRMWKGIAPYKKMINEDSPGNFTVEKKEDGQVIIQVYDESGCAIQAWPQKNRKSER